MKQKTRLLIGVVTFVILAFFIHSVIQKERIIKYGVTVYLELAPVDPRSLMQGDYMQLYYKYRDYPDSLPKRCYFILSQDANGVGQFVRFQNSNEPLSEGELAILCYRNADEWMSIGADSYFFEEGTAALYEEARYGVLKVGANGKQVLIGLANDKFELLPVGVNRGG